MTAQGRFVFGGKGRAPVGRLVFWCAMAAAAVAPDVGLAQSPPPAAEEEPLPILKMPAVVTLAPAPYPEEAKAEGLEATVLLEVEIDAEGKVVSVTVPEPIGFGFDEAAREALLNSQFSPAEDANGPVPVIISFSYSFVLDAQSEPQAQTAPEDQTGTPEAPPAPITLEGVVIEMATRNLLSEVTVAIAGHPEFEPVVTDAEGRWAFRGVPPGNYAVLAARPGYENTTKILDVVEGEVTVARLWIKPEGFAEEAVGVYVKPKDEVTRRTISVEEVRKIPGTFGDPVRVIQSLPGAARSPLGTGLLIIRGSNPEDSGVYVDGIRIPFIYHLGGYVSVLNSDLVQGVDYLPGGYGVQYGRTLGGVIDVTTKKEAPEQARLSWNTDVLDSGVLFEARLGEEGRHHVGVAARRSYVDLFVPLFTRNSEFIARPRWYDYQVRYATKLSDRTTASVFVFGFQDQLFVSTPDDVPQGPDQDAQGDVYLTYATHRVIAQLAHEVSDSLRLTFTPSFGLDTADNGVGNEFALQTDNLLWEIRGEASYRPWGTRLDLIAGIDFIGGWYGFGFTFPFSPGALVEFDPLAERESFSIDGKGTGWGPDLYAKAVIRPFADDPERLVLIPGVRYNWVNIIDKLNTDSLDPRIAFRARLAQNTFLKGGVGIYHQPPQPFESWRPSGEVLLDMERATMYALGVEQALFRGLNVEWELFYKDLQGLIDDNPELVDLSTDQYFVNRGIGRVYGSEIIVRRNPIDRYFGWISYTLSRSERKSSPESENWILFDFDQTHILTAVGGVTLPWTLEVSGRLQYVTGNPYTPYSQGVYDIDQDTYQAFQTDLTNSQRLPAFVALDARVLKRFTFKRARLDVYVDLLNVYRGENPEFVQYNYDYTESRYIRGLPFIPSPGFQFDWYF